MADIELRLSVPDGVARRLEEIRQDVGVETIIDVVKRALSVFDTLTEYEKDGYVVYVVKGSGEASGAPREAAQFHVRSGKVKS